MVDRTTTTTVSFILEAECLDNLGNSVTRYLGMVRGMSDNGRPGWSKYPDGMTSVEEAENFMKHPYALSVYDGNYHGGAMRIKKVTTITTISIEEEYI